MLVGVDFDNTIVCYDGVFHKVAVAWGLVPEELPAVKGQVRDYLRQQGQENAWIELQGYVYGTRILEAVPFPGVLEFLGRCQAHGISVYIISHRTRYPFAGPRYDLHQAARNWLKHYGLGLSVYFEFTKQEKLDRIRKEGCQLFIDDLAEFLAEPGFPIGVRRILFDPDNRYATELRFERAASWEEVWGLIIREGRSA